MAGRASRTHPMAMLASPIFQAQRSICRHKRIFGARAASYPIPFRRLATATHQGRWLCARPSEITDFRVGQACPARRPASGAMMGIFVSLMVLGCGGRG